jgi:hypothetical protein
MGKPTRAISSQRTEKGGVCKRNGQWHWGTCDQGKPGGRLVEHVFPVQIVAAKAGRVDEDGEEGAGRGYDDQHGGDSDENCK